MNIKNLTSYTRTGKIINKDIISSGLKFAQSKDTFERSDITKDLAVKFRNQILLPFGDWEHGIPKNNEEGASILKEKLSPFMKVISTLDSQNTTRFVKLVFGENQAKQLEAGAKVNSDLMKFKTLIEDKMGKTIQDSIK